MAGLLSLLVRAGGLDSKVGVGLLTGRGEGGGKGMRGEDRDTEMGTEADGACI